MNIQKWYRKCPQCGEKIPYTRKSDRDKLKKRNANCKSCAKKGKNNPIYGKKRSGETRKNISESKKGKKRKPFTDEWKKNISKSRKNKKWSEKTKKI